MPSSSTVKRGIVIVGLACLIAMGVVVLIPAKAEVAGETEAEAVQSVVRIADDLPRGAGDALAKAALEDPRPAVRRAAVVSLNRLKRPEHRPVVEKALADEDPTVRAAAAKTLVFCHDDEDTVGRLSAVCLTETDPKVLKAAALALAASDDPLAVVALVQMLGMTDRKDLQRLAAETVKWKLKMRVPIPEVIGSEAWQRVVTSMKFSDAVRNAFAETNTPLEHNMALLKKMHDEHAAMCHAEGEAPAAFKAPAGVEP